MTERVSGIVVSYNDDREFGFIRPDDGTTDCFVRWTEIRGAGHRTLGPGQRVNFDVATDAEGRKALDVRRFD